MSDEKAKFGVVISKDVLKELSAIVQKGSDLKITRSEVVEEMLLLVLENVMDMETFVELLRYRIVERRKQKARMS